MNSKKKYTVITAIFGDYECLHDNQFTRDDFEYICVTDNPNLKSRLWKIIYMPKSIDPSWSPRKKTYYVRYHLFEFCDTQHAIWIDGSVALGDISIPLLNYEFGEYERMFLAGWPLKEWILRDVIDQVNLYNNDISHLIHHFDMIQKICVLHNKVFYENNRVASHYEHEKKLKVVHLNGRFRVYKNTEENHDNMCEIFNTLCSNDFLRENDKTVYYYGDITYFDSDVFYYDEPVTGILTYKLKTSTLTEYRKNIPFVWYEHNSNELRHEDY